jgi:hypothetical protein
MLSLFEFQLRVGLSRSQSAARSAALASASASFIFRRRIRRASGVIALMAYSSSGSSLTCSTLSLGLP